MIQNGIEIAVASRSSSDIVVQRKFRYQIILFFFAWSTSERSSVFVPYFVPTPAFWLNSPLHPT